MILVVPSNAEVLFRTLSSHALPFRVFFCHCHFFSPALSLPLPLSRSQFQWPTERMASDEEFSVIVWMAPLKLCKNHKVNELKTFHNVYGDYIVVKRHYCHRHLHASNSNYFYFLCSLCLSVSPILFLCHTFHAWNVIEIQIFGARDCPVVALAAQLWNCNCFYDNDLYSNC